MKRSRPAPARPVVRRHPPALVSFPATWEQFKAQWLRQHPEDRGLTDAELEVRFQQLQRSAEARG